MLSTVRRVLPFEYGKYRKHLKSLDAESKILRFGYTVSDDVIDSLCDSFENDPARHILFTIENSRLEFLAVGHIAIESEMELAFSVLKPYQGQGMGNQLMARCIQWCRTHGILEGYMVCLSSNVAIKHLCQKYNIIMAGDTGESMAKIKLDKANIITYANEATDDNLAVMDYLGKRAFFPLV